MSASDKRVASFIEAADWVLRLSWPVFAGLAAWGLVTLVDHGNRIAVMESQAPGPAYSQRLRVLEVSVAEDRKSREALIKQLDKLEDKVDVVLDELRRR